jgi:polyphosphate kinase
VSSVIGRFLEHSRIYYFRNGAADPLDGEFYIGSADWMYRNLLARVETIVPIEKRSLKEKCWIILQTLLNDHRQAWDLQSDGTYVQRTPPEGSNDLGTHETLMALARKEAAAYVEAMQGPQ